jgi:RNA polymerase sigma-70 factor (ECF subfamily)
MPRPPSPWPWPRRRRHDAVRRPCRGARPRRSGRRGAAGAADDADLLRQLRAGDERAYLELVERYHAPLVRLAALHVPDRETAEEVVQEAWIGVIRGLHRFEGRSSLRTWLFRIVTYQATSRGRRERRHVPLSALLDDGDGGPTVDPSRFLDTGRWAGHWAEPPADWGADGEARALAAETQAVIASAIETLPPAQRLVITLRDVRGWTSEEVCEALEISPGNQRVLLHRGRARVRAALERHLADVTVAAEATTDRHG